MWRSGIARVEFLSNFSMRKKRNFFNKRKELFRGNPKRSDFRNFLAIVFLLLQLFSFFNSSRYHKNMKSIVLIKYLIDSAFPPRPNLPSARFTPFVSSQNDSIKFICVDLNSKHSVFFL